MFYFRAWPQSWGQARFSLHQTMKENIEETRKFRSSMNNSASKKKLKIVRIFSRRCAQISLIVDHGHQVSGSSTPSCD